jgi:hypothetical protein
VGSVSADGAEFSGAEMIYNFERLLRQVTANFFIEKIENGIISHQLRLTVPFYSLGI